jgi:hypothetical protein
MRPGQAMGAGLRSMAKSHGRTTGPYRLLLTARFAATQSVIGQKSAEAILAASVRRAER